jgi:hypothetical protein
MLIQDIDEVLIKGKKIQYFSPNNIGLLLSISLQHIRNSEKIFIETIKNIDVLENKNKKETLNFVSSIICDYIEKIQIAIVFGYTALETFANLSIPENYEYKKENKTKGIHELYEKESIERWLNLKEKIQYILTDIYKTDKADRQKWWGHFNKLEQFRNDIIHQKTVKSTEFYKDYFKESIFEICKSPKKIIRFFYNSHEKNNQTNPIWPWIEGEINTFPLNTNFDSQNFEIIGNIFDGIKEK